MATPRKIRLKIGVIGLGIIGSRVAANLRAAGHQVYVWSRSPHSAPNFLGSVVEVADLCDVIQIFVSDDNALTEVARTMAAALGPRHVVAAHATVAPETVRRTAAIVEGQGARYLDAPFTGSKMAAQNGQLVYYIGGSEQALAEVRPVLEASSKKILQVGGIGDATILKIATNMLTATTVQTLAEALALVQSAGIDGKKLAEAFEFNASRSGTSDLKLPAMLAQNFDTNFSLKHMLKDVRFALNLAAEAHLDLPITSRTSEILASGVEKGWGEADFSVIAKNYPPPEVPRTTPPAEELPETPPAPAVAVVADAPESPSKPAADALAVADSPKATSGETANAVQPLTERESLPPVDARPLLPPPAEKPDDHLTPPRKTLRIIRDFFRPEIAPGK